MSGYKRRRYFIVNIFWNNFYLGKMYESDDLNIDILLNWKVYVDEIKERFFIV